MSQSSETLTSMSSVKKAFIQPFPNSHKIYVEGSRADIQVPMREITLTDTIGELAEKNDPIHVYDTSGVYTDPTVQIDLRKGLSDIRDTWIDERDDCETLNGMSSNFSNERLDDAGLDALRFEFLKTPKRAKQGKNVTQMHYAKQGIITPEMNTLPFVRIANGKITKIKSVSTKAKALVQIFQMKSQQNLFALKLRADAQ